MPTTINTDQKVKLTVKPLTQKSRPALVHGIPAWSSSNPSIISLVVAPDGLSAYAFAAGTIGTATVGVAADADMSSAIRQIQTTIDITVTAAEAASLVLDPSSPELA